MSALFELLQTPSFQHSAAASVLISITCGIVGVYVVINRLVFISGGISHASLGGVGIGVQLGFANLLLPTLGFSLLAALIMGYARMRFHERIDTLIGVIWALGMGLGIILVENGSSEGEHELEEFLFGNINAVEQSDLLLMGAIVLVVIFAVGFLYKEFLAVSFDQTFSAIMNVPVGLINYILLGLIALTVVIMMQAVGLILVIALLSIPGAIASHLTRDLKRMMGIAILMALVFSLGGLLIAYLTGLPEGPTIVMLAGVGYLISLMPRAVKSYG